MKQELAKGLPEIETSNVCKVKWIPLLEISLYAGEPNIWSPEVGERNVHTGLLVRKMTCTQNIPLGIV